MWLSCFSMRTDSINKQIQIWSLKRIIWYSWSRLIIPMYQFARITSSLVTWLLLGINHSGWSIISFETFFNKHFYSWYCWQTPQNAEIIRNPLDGRDESGKIFAPCSSIQWFKFLERYDWSTPRFFHHVLVLFYIIMRSKVHIIMWTLRLFTVLNICETFHFHMCAHPTVSHSNGSYFFAGRQHVAAPDQKKTKLITPSVLNSLERFVWLIAKWENQQLATQVTQSTLGNVCFDHIQAFSTLLLGFLLFLLIRRPLS